MYNVAKQIARTPIKNVTFPRRCTSSEGSIWTPAQANPQLWSLDNTKHRSGLVTGWDGVSRKVLESNEAYGTYRAPEPGRCYQFDGTDDYIDTPLLSELNNDLTFAMKVKFTTLGTMQLFDGGIPSGNGRRYLGLNSSSKLRFGTHGQTVDGVTTLVSGQWYWCVVTLANLDVTIYLDGVVEKLVTLSSKDNLANNTLKIGRYAGSLSLLLNAKVSFAGVWDRALSAQEVADLPTTVPATPMASYRCNEGDGTTAYDSSGNSNHGTVINATLSTFHATDAGITDNDANIRGYSLQGNARVPAINDTTDALGNSLTYTGQCPHPVGVETPGITNHDGTVYLSAPHLTGSETVTSYEGTGVPTVTAGRIDWPSGTTISQIVLSDGTHYVAQEGPGTSNTNRTVYDVSGGGNHATLISGTVATIWGTRILTASDHCIEYGGRIGAEGEFVSALLDGSAAADGNQITLGPGKHSNPSSRLNWNPFQAAEFNGRHIPQDYAPGDSIASLPTNSVFRQTNASGDTKLLVFESELSVDDLSKTQQYTGNSTGYEDPNLVLLSRKASIVKDRNSNAITVRV